MNKLQLMQLINTNLDSNLKVKDMFFNGKCFVVTKQNRIESVFKTVRGANGYIKRNTGKSYYDESIMELVYVNAGEVIEVLESDVHDLTTSKVMWCNELLSVLSKDYLYNTLEHNAKKYLTGDMLSFVVTRLDNMKNSNSVELCEEFNYYNKKKEYTNRISNIKNRLSECTEAYDINFYNEDLTYYTNELNKLISNTNIDIMNYVDVQFFNEVICDNLANESKVINKETTNIESTKTEVKINESDVKVVLNEEKNGVEIHFNNKPSQDVLNNLKANGFRYSRYNKVWYAKQSETTLNYANTFTNQSEEQIKEISKEYKENKEIEIQNSLNEINIDDIENYIVPEEISKKENENSFFRSKAIDHTKQLQNTLLEANKEVLEVLDNNSNTNIEYNLKMSLQRFKRDYTKTNINYLNIKGSNPSWMVTGRDGRNARRDAKMNDRQTNSMFKINEVVEKFNKSVNSAKNQIKKEKSNLLKQEIKEINDSIKVLPKFKRIKKEIKTTFGSYNKMIYEYNGYNIYKDCSTWRVYDTEGKQIYKTLTTGTLEDAKKWLIYYINKVS